MRTKNARRVAILLILVLALALAVACGGDDNGNGVTPPEGNGGQVTPPADTPDYGNGVIDQGPMLGGIHEPVDFGGRVLTTGGWWHGILAGFRPAYDDPDPATAGNYHMERLIFENARRVEREFGVVFEENIMGSDEILEVLTTSIMAGEPFADLTMANASMIFASAINNLIVPLESINLPNSDLLNRQFYTRVATQGLGHWWAYIHAEPEATGVTLGVNLDLINALGVPNPIDLYNSGQWTWDAFLDIMRTATRDTTGDGIIDQFGIAGQPGDFLPFLIAANDGPLMTDDFQYNMDHPNTIHALEFANTIFREGLWEYDRTIGADIGDWGVNFWAYQNGNSVFWISMTWNMNDGDLPFEFGVVPVPLGPANTSGYTWMSAWRQGYSIPIGNSVWTPAEVLMIGEELLSWPGYEIELMTDGALNWSRHVFLTEEDAVRQVGAMFTMRLEDALNVPGFGGIWGTFVNYFVTQELTVMQAIEAHRGPQQELLDIAFGG